MEKSSISWRRTIWGQLCELFLLLILVFLIRTFGFGLYQVPSGSMETTMLVGERFFADKLTYWFRGPKRGEIIAFNAPTFRYSESTPSRLIEKYVWGPDNWTKRVIGIPGDHVQGVIEDGKPVIYLNGQKLKEPYLNKYPLVYECKSTGYRPDMPFGWSLLAEKCPKSYDSTRSFTDQPFSRINEKLLLRDNQGNIKLKYPDQAQRSPGRMPSGATRFYGNNADEFNVVLGDDEYWLMGDNRRASGDSREWGPVKRNIIHGRIIFRIWSIDSYESWWIVDLFYHPIDFWSRVRWNRFFQVIH